MRKIIFLQLCFAISGYSFSQSLIITDSSKPANVTTNTTTKNTSNKLSPAISIYPNPANNKITLQVKNFDPGMASVKVLDTKGKLVREDNRLLTNGSEDIIMFLMLKAGIYFIMVNEPGKVARKKLVML